MILDRMARKDSWLLQAWRKEKKNERKKSVVSDYLVTNRLTFQDERAYVYEDVKRSFGPKYIRESNFRESNFRETNFRESATTNLNLIQPSVAGGYVNAGSKTTNCTKNWLSGEVAQTRCELTRVLTLDIDTRWVFKFRVLKISIYDQTQLSAA